jgi:DNA-binding XRE family transcriptional regulator
MNYIAPPVEQYLPGVFLWSSSKIGAMPGDKNIVGPQVRKIRYEQGMTQDDLAAACQRLEFDLSRGTLSKIEAGLRCVTDRELAALARALHVSIQMLFPSKTRKVRK